MFLSIVIPTFNEQKNVALLYKHLKPVLLGLKKTFEIIFVDDGSRDRTFSELLKLRNMDSTVKIVRFRGNWGQTAAMDAGFKHARGRIIVSLDADLQNDPRDIPRLIQKLDQGFDVVSGWRKNRKDSLSKHVVSRGANLLRKVILNDRIHDSGCTLKVYRKECFQDLDLFGEMHRFIPALLEWRGFRVAELPVRHHPRKFGQTKYSLTRVFKGFLDMLVVKFWMQYSARPMHLFGFFGLVLSLFGSLIGAYLFVVRVFFNQSIGNRPLLLLAILSIILGFQFVIFGLLADIMVKVFYRGHPNYSIKEIVE